MKTLKSLIYIIIAASLVSTVFGQLIAYESFSGIPVRAGLTGSGNGALGWTDASWSGGSDHRFQTINSTPDLIYQIDGGALLDGSDRAVQLSTNPEPIPSQLLAVRTITAQNTTIYASFLARVSAIGTGSDTIDVRFNNGSSLLARITFTPDQEQRYLRVGLPTDGGGGSSGGGSNSGPLYLAQTYLIVVRLTRPSPTQVSISAWVNPHGTSTQGSGLTTTKSVSGSATINTIGLGIASADSGGPTTTMSIDELRVGYTWSDVVLPGPPIDTVPDLTIRQAVRLQWQSQIGKVYQVQSSYDLAIWNNFGTPISGDGNIKKVFDASDDDSKKFYRVQAQ